MIQFKVARAGKFDGKKYEAGDPFPYDPANPMHLTFYTTGKIKAERVKAEKPKAPPKKTRIRKVGNGS